MKSSPRIIKAGQAANGADRSTIETEIQLLEEKIASVDESTEFQDEEVADALRKKQSILKQAAVERAEMLEQAEAAIEQLRKETFAQALADGQQKGFDQGYADGYDQGFTTGQTESHKLKEEAWQQLTIARTEIDDYVKDKKQEWMELAIHMAENILHDQLAKDDKKLLNLIHPVVQELDRQEDFVALNVHPTEIEKVKALLPTLKETYSDKRFVVYPDSEIERNGCVIESTRAVVDLQIHQQLANVLKEMKEMERA
ncbi:FliH/SctL family protein [Lacticigenium naphthae]|uniref:FliH/SctL family protein n=1 Tax=Lacticigenium naphthae TaxID=515351 RepID=UPI00041B12E4|nr:FliH/SctL family protein [Lacticigenium naphthae]